MRAVWVLPFLLLACGAPDRGSTRIVGHGGMGPGGPHPMNSGTSIREAMELAIDGIEVDVQLTADGVLVAYHEMDLIERTGCGGKVNAVRWSELARCPVGGSGSTRYPIVRIDSLLMDCAVRHPEADFTLDCKLFAEGDWWTYLHAFADAVLALDALPLLHGRILVDCQTEDFLRLLTGKRNDFPAYLYVNSMAGAVERAAALGCTGITVEHSRASASDVRAAHEAGLRVTFFGADGDWSHRSALGKRPDRLQTDAPKRFAR